MTDLVLILSDVFAVWSFLVTGLLVCVMFIQDEGWVYWLNFKVPPNAEYMVAILILGVTGGLVCYCWEVPLLEQCFDKV